MWVVIKAKKKNFSILRSEICKKIGQDVIFYYPKFTIKKYFNSKVIEKEIDLLGGYVFCFHKTFDNYNTLRNLKFMKGLQYFLEGSQLFQKEIKCFVEKCKNNENSSGFLNYNFLDLCLNRNYKFISGPFADKIFKIIKIQKDKINIMLSGIKTTINKKNSLFYPA
tara:strand:- start:11207 stop:11704 length:498 start_codon:yes stop_codon:yes gene_type:complete